MLAIIVAHHHPGSLFLDDDEWLKEKSSIPVMTAWRDCTHRWILYGHHSSFLPWNLLRDKGVGCIRYPQLGAREKSYYSLLESGVACGEGLKRSAPENELWSFTLRYVTEHTFQPARPNGVDGPRKRPNQTEQDGKSPSETDA